MEYFILVTVRYDLYISPETGPTRYGSGMKVLVKLNQSHAKKNTIEKTAKWSISLVCGRRPSRFGMTTLKERYARENGMTGQVLMKSSRALSTLIVLGDVGFSCRIGGLVVTASWSSMKRT